jgi:hypothetical protein
MKSDWLDPMKDPKFREQAAEDDMLRHHLLTQRNVKRQERDAAATSGNAERVRELEGELAELQARLDRL